MREDGGGGKGCVVEREGAKEGHLVANDPRLADCHSQPFTPAHWHVQHRSSKLHKLHTQSIIPAGSWYTICIARHTMLRPGGYPCTEVTLDNNNSH